MSVLRLLPKRWRERIRNYAPRGFPDSPSCGAFYDARARLFRDDEAASLEYSSLGVQRRIFARAVDALPPHGRVLDVGCGLAHLHDYIIDREFPIASYHGIDVSAAMLDAASQRIGGRENVSFEQRDLATRPMESSSYDVAYVISVLGYPIGRDPMASMLSLLRSALDACADGLVFTHVMDGRSNRTLAFPTDPDRLAEECALVLGADATIFDNGEDFTYLMRLRKSSKR